MKCTKEHRLRYTDRAKEIVKGITLEENVSVMSGQAQLEQMIKDITEDGNHDYKYIPYSAPSP